MTRLIMWTPTRGLLTQRAVVAVRGTAAALAARLWHLAAARGAAHRRGASSSWARAPWIWNLAEVLFPHRIEILDWYHANERVSGVARVLYGEGTEKAAAWRTTQLDRFATDSGQDPGRARGARADRVAEIPAGLQTN